MVSGEESDRRSVATSQSEINPSTKAAGVSPMGSFVRKEVVVGQKAGAPCKVPGGTWRSNVVNQVSKGTRILSRDPSSKVLIWRHLRFVETVLSKEAKASVTFGELTRIKVELKAIRSRLWPNILKSNERGIRGRLGGKGVTKGLAIRGVQRYTQ